MGFNYDGRFCHDWFNHISFLFLRVQQSVSALDECLHELKTVFFCGFFLQIYSSRCTSTFTFVGSHLRLCVHAYVCEACRRTSADICFCACNLCVSMHICVFMRLHERTGTDLSCEGDFFPFRTVRFLRTLCTCAYVREFGVYRCTSACKKPESHCEWTPVTVASSCTVEDRLNVPEQDAIRGGAAGQ